MMHLIMIKTRSILVFSNYEDQTQKISASNLLVQTSTGIRHSTHSNITHQSGQY